MLIYCRWTLFYYCDSVKICQNGASRLRLLNWIFFTVVVERTQRIDKVNVRWRKEWNIANELNFSRYWIILWRMFHYVGAAGVARMKWIYGKMVIVTWSEWPLLGRLVFWVPANKYVWMKASVYLWRKAFYPGSVTLRVGGCLTPKIWKKLIN